MNFRLWENKHHSFAKTPDKQEMCILLVEDWETKYKLGQARVYPVGPEDRALIDKVFDELHDQGRLRWTSEATPFSFLCFVVWKKSNAIEKKGGVVVDIRALNQITMPDAYPIRCKQIYSQRSPGAYSSLRLIAQHSSSNGRSSRRISTSSQLQATEAKKLSTAQSWDIGIRSHTCSVSWTQFSASFARLPELTLMIS